MFNVKKYSTIMPDYNGVDSRESLVDLLFLIKRLFENFRLKSSRRPERRRMQIKQKITRTVRKSDYTPALALPKHMTGIFDEKCREKEKYREEQIGECSFSISHHNLPLCTCISNLKILS